MLKDSNIGNTAFLKWFQRPSDPSDPWDFTEAAIECIIEKHSDTPGFAFESGPNEETDKRRNAPFKNLIEVDSNQESLLNSFLREISHTEASFPNCSESILISETLDQVVTKMTHLLQKRSNFFKDCSVLKVGSTNEGLKSGSLNEFDFNLILPNLAEHVDFLHSNHNGILTDMINKRFFGSSFIKGYNEAINFKLRDFDILDGIVLKSELEENYERKLDDFEELLSKGKMLDESDGDYDEETSRKKWMNVLCWETPIPQRSHFEIVFPALDRIVEEVATQSLPEALEILPKKSVRDFRSMNQVAITLNLLWKRSLNINVDFALVLPVSKRPIWYDLNVYLQEEKKSLMPTKILLKESDETFRYVIRSYKTCRLSAGEKESEMFKKFSVDSVIKQSIRVCKKLRDIYMKHYFDVSTETLNPVLPSYWIKTVAMHLYDISELSVNHDTKATLSQSVIQIFERLHKCLTGDQGKQPPFLASYTDPFKNLLDFVSISNDIDEDKGSIYVDEDLKDITFRANIVVANDIEQLLEILVRIDQDDTQALEDIDALRKCNDLNKKDVQEKGMKTKLGVLMYEHFEEIGITHNQAAQKEPPVYIEFIKRNFPSMEIIHLNKEVELWYRGTQTVVDIQLLENGEEVDLKEIFETAYNKINYWDGQRTDTMIEDHYHDHSWIK